MELKVEPLKIPRISINDEPAWTPKATPLLESRIKSSGISKKYLIVITVVIFLIIIIGVVVGNLISNAVAKDSSKIFSIFISKGLSKF